MEKRNLICIGCPMGCMLEVELEGKEVIKVTGNTCKRGEDYGKKECTNPTRIVTSTVRVKNGTCKVVPIKTDKDIPKSLIFQCMKALKEVEVEAPIKIGQVIVKHILGTDADIVATKSIDVKEK